MTLAHLILLCYFACFYQNSFGENLITFGSNGKTYRNERKTHFISRRSVDASICKKDSLDEEATKKIQKHAFPLKEDNHIDLDVVYVGKNTETQLLLTTSPQSFIGMLFTMGHHSSSTIYQTTDGGRTFQKLDSEINSATIRNKYGIMVSPLDPDWMILASYTPFISAGFFNIQTNQDAFLLISKNGSKNFTSVKVPFKLRDGEPLLFHPKKKDWVIALEERQTISKFGQVSYYGKAFISKDFGTTWKAMNGDHIAATVKWGLAEGKEGDEIFMTTHQKSPDSLFSIFNTFTSSSTLTLWRSSDGGKTFETIIEHCYRFGVQGEFVFASVIFSEGGESDNPHDQKRILHVSKDSGKTFHAVNVPEITHDRFYSVEDMEKGMIFLHVDDPGDTGKGVLYMSGSDGLMFTKSLSDHFYTNMNRQTDFTKIESMHGVYITQVLTKDSTLKSVITFNRGVTWQPLYVDKKKYCNTTTAECTLHFHKVYSNAKQRSDIQHPLSSKSAPGIIFLHGQAGDALTGSAQVWLSTNGGYNWTLVDKNPHHYAIGDAGNLLVIIPRFNNTGNYLKYSIDQGRCWQKYQFYDNANEELVIRGLVTEPHSKERSFSIWGYVKDASPYKREFVVITIHFHKMFSKVCERSDLEEWTPHSDNGKAGCFLGEKLFYGRPKLDADCYLGNEFNPLLRHSPCKCTRDDIECDYGYEKESDGKCRLNLSIKPIEICRKGEVLKERFSKGYRRLPGDICESTEEDEIIKYIDEKKKCEPSEEKIEVFGVVSEEKKLAAELEKEKKKAVIESGKKEGESHYQTVIHPKKKKGHSFFFVVGVLALIGIVFGIGYYGVRHVRNSRYIKPAYVMSDLLDDEANDSNTVFDSRPKSYRPFKDESDVEDDVMLPV